MATDMIFLDSLPTIERGGSSRGSQYDEAVTALDANPNTFGLVVGPIKVTSATAIASNLNTGKVGSHNVEDYDFTGRGISAEQATQMGLPTLENEDKAGYVFGRKVNGKVKSEVTVKREARSARATAAAATREANGNA